MKKKNVKILLSLLLVLLTCSVLTGCSSLLPKKELSDEEVVSAFLTAYQNGDYEGLKPYIDADNQLHQIFSMLADGNTTGMGEVYQKAHELTKGLTFTAEAVEGKEKWGEVKVHIQTADIVDGIPDAMDAALLSQAENGDDSFSNLPSWLLAGLQAGDVIDEEFTVYVGSRDGNNVMDTNTNLTLFEKITGGFYEYIDTTMTTCTEEGNIYEVASMGDSIIGMMETVEQTEDTEGLTDEDIRYYEESYAGIDGLIVRVEKKDDGGLNIRFGVDFDRANSKTLANMGIISDRITAGGGYLSLSSTVGSFEESGMSCVTDAFGAPGVPSAQKK